MGHYLTVLFLLLNLKQSIKAMFQVCVVVVILGLASMDRLFTFLAGYKEFFDPYMYTCDVHSLDHSPLVLLRIIWSVLVPGLFICSTNVYLIYKAARLTHSRKRRNVKGTLTVILMCGTFLLSYIPFCIALEMSYGNNGERGLEFTVSNSFMGINVIVNPLIYTFTNKRFCTFMKSMIGIEPATQMSFVFWRVLVPGVSSDTSV